MFEPKREITKSQFHAVYDNSKEKILVYTNGFSKETNTNLKRIGYRWNGEIKIWYKEVPRTRKAIEYDILDYRFGGGFSFEEINKIKDNRELIIPNHAIHLWNDIFMNHQRESIQRFFYQYGFIMYAHSMGTGKTLTSIGCAEIFEKQMLVISTVSMMDDWKKEILKWGVCGEDKIFVYNKDSIAPKNIRDYKYFIFNYERFRFINVIKDIVKIIYSDIFKSYFGKPALKEFELMKKLMRYEDFYNFSTMILTEIAKKRMVIEEDKKETFEKVVSIIEKKLSSLTPKEMMWFKFLSDLNKKNTIIVLDETYKIKSYKSELSRCYSMIRNYDWFGFIALSGTPYENNLYEFYNVLSVVHPFWMPSDFFNSHFIYKESNWDKPKYINLEKFNEYAKTIMYRVEKKDVVPNMKDPVQKFIFVETDKRAHEVFNFLKDKANSVMEIYQLMRVLDSYFKPSPSLKYFEELKEFGEITNEPKYEALLNCLDEVGNEQVLIFTAFSTTAEWLSNRLIKDGVENRFVCSDTNGKINDSISDNFKAGKQRIVISTDIWSRGKDFPNVNNEFNFDLPLNPSVLAQRRDRIHRISSDQNTLKVIVSLVGSIIEREVYNILMEKSKNALQAVDSIQADDVYRELSKRFGFEKFCG